MAKTQAPKKNVEIDEEEIDEEEETEEEETEEKPAAKKKKAAAKEETPEWAKMIIKLLQPKEQEPAAKIIPTPKPPARKEEGADLESQNQIQQQQQNEKPKQTFLGWFW